MTKKRYNFIVGCLLFSFFFSPIIIKIIYGESLLFANVTGTFVAISTFLFGVYFYFSEFRKENKIIKPIFIIFFGISHLMLTSGSMLFTYYIHQKIGVVPYQMPKETIEKLKEMALTDCCPEQPNVALMRAKTVFDETGERIDYLNENKSIVKYVPNEKDIKKRNRKIAQEKETRIQRNTVQQTVWLQLITVALSIVIFIFLICRIPPRKVLCKI